MSREGDYLRKLLVAAGFPPQDCYLTLMMKTPPKGKPTVAEIEAGGPFLLTELVHVQPKLVLALGSSVTRFLLGLKRSSKLNQVTGRIHHVLSPWFGSVMPWYSANYLLSHGRKLEQQTISLLKQLKASLV